MTLGLRCCQPACRPHPASLPVRVPTVESLLRASFSFTSRLRLALRYGCRHRPRLAPFIQLDSAHAGHTGAGTRACRAETRLDAPPPRAQLLLFDRNQPVHLLPPQLLHNPARPPDLDLV